MPLDSALATSNILYPGIMNDLSEELLRKG